MSQLEQQLEFVGVLLSWQNPASQLHLSYSALSFQIWQSEKSELGSWIQEAEMLQTHGFEVIHETLPGQISTASHVSCSVLVWDQQVKLEFLVLFRCSCWTFSQGSSFLSLYIDGWPRTRLMGKYLWSFLYYSRVSLFFQVSTIPQQSQTPDWCR